MPYRGGKEAPAVAPVREGLVADMVRQFADPHAFVRELVQNGIDAGASELEIAARFDGTRATFSVSDDGGGMSREIIEGPLLTLFTSAKDGDETKIGKYGVGFVSVFAIEPDHVEVETWQAGGESWQLTLFPDHRYELRRGEAARRTSPSGTRVTLVKAMAGEAFDETWRAIGVALSRWCRHATIPLHWIVERAGRVHRERADRPFAVAAPFSVESELEGARLVVGVATGASYLFEGDDERPLAGYYNRGLTLAERRRSFDVLSGVRFKVDSPALQHTLSRDDVRQDEAYHRLVRHAMEVVNGALYDGLWSALAAAASGDDPARYVALLAAAGPAGLKLVPECVTVPLCHPVAGWTSAARRSDPVAEAWSGDLATGKEVAKGGGPVLWSAEPDELTAALAAEGRAVVRVSHVDVPTLLEQILEVSLEPAEETFLLLDDATPTKLEQRYLNEVRRVLDRVGVAFHAVGMAQVSGTAPLRAGYAVSSPATSHLVHAVTHPRFRGGGGGRRLLLSRSHPAAQAARRLARKSPSAAGQLLARYLLVEDRGELSRGLCDDLLEWAEEGL